MQGGSLNLSLTSSKQLFIWCSGRKISMRQLRAKSMMISKRLLKEIMDNLPKKLPETGGIIGGTNGNITTYWIDEVQKTKQSMCSYVPDTDKMNSIIEKWFNEGIEFLGIFHTHYYGVKTLSEADKDYMCRIINSMPESIKILYFPVFVFPNNEMILYAIKNQTMEIMLCNYYII